MLPDKYSEASKSERFSIYTISNITDGNYLKTPAIKPPENEEMTSKPGFVESEVDGELNRNFTSADMPPAKHVKKFDKFTYYKTEILAGIIVGFVLVPEACVFALIANIDPAASAHTSWVLGIVCSIFGGRPAMIPGLTGGLASMISGLVSPEKQRSGSGKGVEEFFLSTIVAGVIIMLVGLFKIGKFQVMIPATVKVGFCNGLAIIILKGQMFILYDENKEFITGPQLAIILIYIMITAIIFDKFQTLKYKCFKMIPSAFVSMAVVVVIEFAIVRNCGYYTMTLGDIAPFTSDNAYPRLFFINPLYDMNAFDSGSGNRIIVNAILIAAMSLLETAMSLEVVNEYTNTEGNLNREYLALGAANACCGMLGASIGGAMLGVSTINCVNGSKGRTSTFVGGFFVLIVMVGAYPILNFIPLGVLVGMLVVVFYKTFKWFTITAIIAELVPPKMREKLNIHNRRIPKLELLIIITVSVLTIVVNLLIATMAGIVIAGMAFAYNNSSLLEVKIEIREKAGKKIKVYIVQGPVFYATKKGFFKLFDIEHDPIHVQIDFTHDIHMDYTFIEALNKLCKKYKESGRDIKIKKLKRSAQKTVEKFHRFVNNIEFIEENIELPGVPQFIENIPNEELEEIEENPNENEDENKETNERFQNLENPTLKINFPPIFNTNISELKSEMN